LPLSGDRFATSRWRAKSSSQWYGSRCQSATVLLTGERTVPGVWHENYWFRRHEAAYLAAVPYVRGATVLDAGCGEGYGAARLAMHARKVVALDTDHGTVAYVRRRYGRVVNPVCADLHCIPLRDRSVEVVVCLQVVEHLHDQRAFVAECARVLRPAGTLVLSTPNRLTFSPGLDHPENAFHTRELSADELRKLLEPHFLVQRTLGVRHGPRLRRVDRTAAVRRLGAGLGAGLVAAQLATPPERWPPVLGRLVAGVRAADFTVDARDVDPSLDLLVVATRGRTDSLPA
jgi:SAM-dependent methyltransferase